MLRSMVSNLIWFYWFILFPVCFISHWRHYFAFLFTTAFAKSFDRRINGDRSVFLYPPSSQKGFWRKSSFSIIRTSKIAIGRTNLRRFSWIFVQLWTTRAMRYIRVKQFSWEMVPWKIKEEKDRDIWPQENARFPAIGEEDQRRIIKYLWL